MYSFVPHSHAISILLMFSLWLKKSYESSFYFENLVQVLPSTISFCVSDSFVFLSCSWTEKNRVDLCCFDSPFVLTIYFFRIISLIEDWIFQKIEFSIYAFWIFYICINGIILNTIHLSNLLPFHGSIMICFLR